MTWEDDDLIHWMIKASIKLSCIHGKSDHNYLSSPSGIQRVMFPLFIQACAQIMMIWKPEDSFDALWHPSSYHNEAAARSILPVIPCSRILFRCFRLVLSFRYVDPWIPLFEGLFSTPISLLPFLLLIHHSDLSYCDPFLLRLDVSLSHLFPPALPPFRRPRSSHRLKNS